jgi:methionine synthase II (cobalamin-independent)
LEDKEDILDALNDITEFIPAERVHVNPNCGLKGLQPEIAFNKLVNMAEIVREFENQK